VKESYVNGFEIFDISMPVSADWRPHSPDVYPRTEFSKVLDRDTGKSRGRVSRSFTGILHTGTHIDAPEHMVAEGSTVDQYCLDQFVGEAALLDLRDCVAGREIDEPQLRAAAAGLDLRDRVVVLCTGWGDQYGEEGYFERSPYLTQQAARWLIGCDPAMVGTDFTPTRHEGDTDFPKRILFSTGKPFLSNLTRLPELIDRSAGRRVTIMALPVRFVGVESAFSRAVALISDDFTVRVHSHES
jgi:kynurenine formamidase